MDRGGQGRALEGSLDKDELRRFLELAQQYRATTVMQAPKVTMFSGQTESLELSDERLLLTSIEVTTDDEGNLVYKPKNEPVAHGLRLAMQPIVSKDGRSVHVAMNGYWSQPAGPVALIPVQIPVTPVRDADESGEDQAGAGMFSMCFGRQRFNQVHVRQEAILPDGSTMLIHAGVVPVEVAKTGLGGLLSRLLGADTKTSADRHILFIVTPGIVLTEE